MPPPRPAPPRRHGRRARNSAPQRASCAPPRRASAPFLLSSCPQRQIYKVRALLLLPLSMDSVRLPLELAVALAQDETVGYVLIDISVEDQVRWKVGSWISSHNHLRVNCPALLTVNEGKGSYGTNTDGGNGYFRFHATAACAVDV